MTEYRLLYLTVSNSEAGRALARRMVEERLAACAHLLPAGQSFYRWQGKLMEEAEQIVIAKTCADIADQAIARIAEWHEYEVPCVLALPIEAGHQPFLRWIDGEVGGVAAGRP
jgi:periplasmic divalent cation tolerance protein